MSRYERNAAGARELLRRRGRTDVNYSEINLFGVYVAPIMPMLPLAWLVTVGLRRLANHFGLLRMVWHPALFVFSIYLFVLSSIVLLAGQ